MLLNNLCKFIQAASILFVLAELYPCMAKLARSDQESTESSSKRSMKAQSTGTYFTKRTNISPQSSSESRKKRTPLYLLPEKDQSVLKAAKLFFENDNISLDQAKGRFSVSEKTSSSSQNSAIASQPIHSVPSVNSPTSSSSGIAETGLRPFSSGMIRHDKKGPKPVGYDTNQQTIARHAERLIRKGTTNSENDALNLGKAKILAKQKRKSELMASWRHMARTDPSQARQMKTNVPIRRSKAHYVSLRAHQLDHQGKAKGMEAATQMAKTEMDQALSRKNQRARHLQARRKLQNGQQAV